MMIIYGIVTPYGDKDPGQCQVIISEILHSASSIISLDMIKRCVAKIRLKIMH